MSELYSLIEILHEVEVNTKMKSYYKKQMKEIIDEKRSENLIYKLLKIIVESKKIEDSYIEDCERKDQVNAELKTEKRILQKKYDDAEKRIIEEYGVKSHEYMIFTGER
tara:strand:+ start:216 stop:542 length:327 start_codon:yes stop_codon:yes gene_type:complete